MPSCIVLFFSRNDITWHVFTGVTSCFHDKKFYSSFYVYFLYQTINMFNAAPIEALQTARMLYFLPIGVKSAEQPIADPCFPISD